METLSYCQLMERCIALEAEVAELRAREQKPVAYMYKDNLHTDVRFSLHTRFGNWSQEDINEYEITEIPLYAAPPAPVVPENPPEHLLPQGNSRDATYRRGATINGWMLCRAAMLQNSK